MTYSDFSIMFLSANEDLVRVRFSSPMGEHTSDLRVPWGRDEWEAFNGFGRDALQTESNATRDLSAASTPKHHGLIEEFGDRLFRFLFQGRARPLWDQTVGASAEGEGQGVRIRLTFDLAQPGLIPAASLPWELLYDRDNETFLALDGRTPVVRYLDVQRPLPRVSSVAPWRVLVVASQPGDVPRLALEEELACLREISNETDAIQLMVAKDATVDGIRDAMQGSRIHAIHFMGHGIYDEKAGEGGLLLERPGGGSRRLLGRSLGTLLNGIDVPLLVVLNSCETAVIQPSRSRVPVEPFSGAATALVHAGVPAVVAMQRPIGDADAILFSRRLFSTLQSGRSLDWAISEARLRLRDHLPGSEAWAIPSLFTRVQDCRIVRQPATSDPASVRSQSPQPLVVGRDIDAKEIDVIGEKYRGYFRPDSSQIDSQNQTLIMAEREIKAGKITVVGISIENNRE